MSLFKKRAEKCNTNIDSFTCVRVPMPRNEEEIKKCLSGYYKYKECDAHGRVCSIIDDGVYYCFMWFDKFYHVGKTPCMKDPLNEKYLLYDVSEYLWEKGLPSIRIEVDERKEEIKDLNLKGNDIVVQLPIQDKDEFSYQFIDAQLRIITLNVRNEGGIFLINGKVVFPDATGKYLNYIHRWNDEKKL